MSRVKGIPGRRFDRETKSWSVPASQESVGPLVSFAGVNGFLLGEGVKERIARVRQEHDEKLVASRAADADIEVEGLGGTLRPFQRAGVAYACSSARCTGSVRCSFAPGS